MSLELPPQSMLSIEEAAWARQQLLRLKRTSQVRPILQRYLDNPASLGTADVAILQAALDRPRGLRWREQSMASWILGRASKPGAQAHSTIQQMGKMLRAYALSDLLRILVISWGVSTTTLMAALCSIFPSILQTPGAFLGVGFLSGLGLLPIVWLSLSIWGDIRLNYLRAMLTEALGRIGSAEAATPLARAYNDIFQGRQGSFDKRLRSACSQALPRTLKALQPHHYLNTEPDLIPALCSILNHAEPTLTLEILEVLERMGDGRAVAPLARLEKRSRSVAVQNAIVRIMPILLHRQQQEQAHTTLLRASGAPAETGDVLLRPAQGVFADAHNKLLRPAEFDLGIHSTPLSSYDFGAENAPQAPEAPSPALEAIQSIAGGVAGAEPNAYQFDAGSMDMGASISASIDVGIVDAGGSVGGAD